MNVGTLAAGQIICGECAGLRQGRGGAIENDLAAQLAGAGAHVDQPVCGQHHLWIVFHHQQ